MITSLSLSLSSSDVLSWVHWCRSRANFRHCSSGYLFSLKHCASSVILRRRSKCARAGNRPLTLNSVVAFFPYAILGEEKYKLLQKEMAQIFENLSLGSLPVSVLLSHTSSSLFSVFSMTILPINLRRNSPVCGLRRPRKKER